MKTAIRDGLEWSETLPGGRMPWAKADAACKALGEGWRLPTRRELVSLVDDTRHAPAIDAEVFPDTQSAAYWTSTPAAWSPSSAAWVVGFCGGYAGVFHHGITAFVRAVRAVERSSKGGEL